MQWFIENRPDLGEYIETQTADDGFRRFLSLVNRNRLKRVLSYMLDENEFLSQYGIRGISRFHKDHPYSVHVNGNEHRVDYEPAESTTGLFGGNSNWRGPIWFPLNYLIIESLQNFISILVILLKWNFRPAQDNIAICGKLRENFRAGLRIFFCVMKMGDVRSLAAQKHFKKIPTGKITFCSMNIFMAILAAA